MTRQRSGRAHGDKALRVAGLGSLMLLAAAGGAFLGVVADGGTAALAAAEPAGETSPNDPPSGSRAETTPGEAHTAPPPQLGPAQPAETYPANLLQLPAAVDTALVCDLRKNRMYVYEKSGDRFSKTRDFFVAVGKNGIDKRREGDEKTPVGIYFPSSFIPGSQIPPIYGAGAFPITYPNSWDRLAGRTGSGIWIHGTDKDDDSLLPLSSRGCLTLRDPDFLSLAKLIRLRATPVIVSSEVEWASSDEIRSLRDSLAATVEAWRRDWESLDTARYLAHYSEAFRAGRMDLKSWTAHKTRVNRSKSFVKVELADIGIYRYPGEEGLFMVTFRQSYRSSNFQGHRWKQQFWRLENGAWRILHEGGV